MTLRLFEVLDRLPMLCHQRSRLVDARQGLRRKVAFKKGAKVLRAHGAVVDQFGEGVHLAVEIDQNVGPLAGRQHVAEILQRLDEGARIVAAPPGLGDLADALFLGEAGRVLLMLLIEREASLLPALAAGILGHAVRKKQTVIARELARHHHQLLVIEGLMHGLAVLGVDARPDNVAVLATLLDVKDDRPRLAGEVELSLSAIDIIEILRAGQLALRRVGIDREAVEIVAAPGHRMGADFPLGERAVEVAGDGAAQIGDLDIFVVEGVLQVSGEVLPLSALAGLGDHGFLPRALKQAARISMRERAACSIAARFSPVSAAFGATPWSASRT